MTLFCFLNIINPTKINYIDIIIGFVFIVFICKEYFEDLKRYLYFLIDSTPIDINLEKIKKQIQMI